MIRFVDGFVGFQSMGIITWTAEIRILAIYLVTVDFSAMVEAAWEVGGGWSPRTWHVSFTARERNKRSVRGSVDPEQRLLTFDWVEQERKWTVDIYLFRIFLQSPVSVFVHAGFSLVSTQ